MIRLKKDLYRWLKGSISNIASVLLLVGIFYFFREVVGATDDLGLSGASVQNSFNNYAGDKSKDITYNILKAIKNVLFPLASTIAIYSIVYSGIKMVTADSEESIYGKYKKQLGWSLGALIVIILASPLVGIFFSDAVVQSPKSSTSGIEWLIKTFINDNVINFIKYLLYSVAVLMTVYSGMMIIVSEDEGTKTKYKKQILYTLIALAIVLVLDMNFNGNYGQDGLLKTFYAGTEKWGNGSAIEASKKMTQFFFLNVFNFIKYILGAIAVFVLIWSGMKIVLAGGDEGEVKKNKQQVIWVAIGLMVIVAGDAIINGFYGGTYGTSFVDIKTSLDKATQGSFVNTFIIDSVVPLLEIIAGLFALLMLVVAGYKLMMSGENSEALGKVKTHILWSAIGFGFILLAETLTTIFYGTGIEVHNTIKGGITGTNISMFASELGGILKFVEQLIAVGAVLMIIYGGAKIILNAGESGVESAKKIITGAVVALTLVIISSTLVTAVFLDTGTFGVNTFIKPLLSGGRDLTDFKEEFIGIINWSLGFLSLFCFVLIIYAGMKLLIPSNDDTKLKAAKDTIMYALLGMAIIITSWTIVNTLI